MTITVILPLAALTFLIRGGGALAGRLPPSLVARTANLAPALLAALVVTGLVPRSGPPDGAVTAGAAVAAGLTAVRAPFVVSVVGAAAVAATVRLLA